MNYRWRFKDYTAYNVDLYQTAYQGAVRSEFIVFSSTKKSRRKAFKIYVAAVISRQDFQDKKYLQDNG